MLGLQLYTLGELRWKRALSQPRGGEGDARARSDAEAARAELARAAAVLAISHGADHELALGARSVCDEIAQHPLLRSGKGGS